MSMTCRSHAKARITGWGRAGLARMAWLRFVLAKAGLAKAVRLASRSAFDANSTAQAAVCTPKERSV